MTLVLLIAGCWIGFSLAALPLAARLLRPHPACRADSSRKLAGSSGCSALGQCSNASNHDGLSPVSRDEHQ